MIKKLPPDFIEKAKIRVGGKEGIRERVPDAVIPKAAREYGQKLTDAERADVKWDKPVKPKEKPPIVEKPTPVKLAKPEGKVEPKEVTTEFGGLQHIYEAIFPPKSKKPPAPVKVPKEIKGPEQKKTWVRWREFWTPFSTVPKGKEALFARSKAMGDLARVERFIDKLFKQLDKFPDDVKIDGFRYLDGQIPKNVLPADSIRIIESIRQRTKTIGRMLVKRNIINQEQFKALKGKYVHHMYAKHILGDDAIVNVAPTGKLNLSYAKARKKLSDTEKKVLGQIEDMAVAVPVGMGKALTDIMKYDYLEILSKKELGLVWEPSMVKVSIGKDGSVYVVGMYDPNLYALDPNDGSVKWICNLGSPFDQYGRQVFGWPFASPVVAENGTVYQVLAYDPNLYAIDPNTGTVIWSIDLGISCDFYFDYIETNYDPPPMNLIEQECGDWFGVEPNDWLRYIDMPSWSTPALGPDGTIYVSFDDPYLRALDPNGSVKWVTRLGATGGFTITVGNNGLVYAASDDDYLCIVDSNGVEKARYQSDNWPGHPVISAENTILVGESKDNTTLISYTNNRVRAISSEECDSVALDLHEPFDTDGSRSYDFIDFAFLANNWLDCTDWHYDMYTYELDCSYSGDIAYFRGDLDRNRYVNYLDLALLASKWLEQY